MERVELGDALLIAEIHTGIEAKRLARMDRVITLVQSALAAPFGGFGGVELFPTLEAKAAIYCSRLVAYDPLPDGNKRTAYDVMIEFVERNGCTWTHSAEGLAETATMIERLAGKPPLLSEKAFRAWVARRIS
jgi:death-on-curing protein